VWRPLLRFALLGALLFTAERVFLSKPPRPEPVVLSGARLEALRDEAARFGGEPQGEKALAALVQNEVDDELLYRRALELGLDRDDPVVQRRLVQNLRFAGAGPERDDASLYAEALALGLDRSDPVVRRRLIQRMRLVLEAEALATEPSEAELRARYEADALRYAEPARTRFVQLYFAREHADAARVARVRLQAQPSAPEAAAELGEPFLHPALQPPQSEAELAARFGVEFARALSGLATGVWEGPIESAYGQHLVYVQERTPAGRAPFESVRSQVRLGVQAERRARILEAELARLRDGVEVVMQAAAPR
jgi:parvulin-like peptidyl-prolyl isomerase